MTFSAVNLTPFAKTLGDVLAQGGNYIVKITLDKNDFDSGRLLHRTTLVGEEALA